MWAVHASVYRGVIFPPSPHLILPVMMYTWAAERLNRDISELCLDRTLRPSTSIEQLECQSLDKFISFIILLCFGLLTRGLHFGLKIVSKFAHGKESHKWGCWVGWGKGGRGGGDGKLMKHGEHRIIYGWKSWCLRSNRTLTSTMKILNSPSGIFHHNLHRTEKDRVLSRSSSVSKL